VHAMSRRRIEYACLASPLLCSYRGYLSTIGSLECSTEPTAASGIYGAGRTVIRYSFHKGSRPGGRRMQDD
jgi:hypothetical protein